MNQYLTDPVTFLIEVLFGLYILVVMLRFLFQLLKVDFYNPISQTVVMLTNPPLRILRRFIPSIGKFDTSSLILMFVLQYLSTTIVLTLKGASYFPLMFAALSLVELINLTFNVFIFSIVIMAILSWVSNPYQQNPLASVLAQLTYPILKPVRRFLPTAGGIDFSPMLVIIGLIFLKLLLIPPLIHLVRMVPF